MNTCRIKCIFNRLWFFKDKNVSKSENSVFIWCLKNKSSETCLPSTTGHTRSKPLTLTWPPTAADFLSAIECRALLLRKSQLRRFLGPPLLLPTPGVLPGEVIASRAHEHPAQHSCLLSSASGAVCMRENRSDTDVCCSKCTTYFLVIAGGKVAAHEACCRPLVLCDNMGQKSSDELWAVVTHSMGMVPQRPCMLTTSDVHCLLIRYLQRTKPTSLWQWQAEYGDEQL